MRGLNIGSKYVPKEFEVQKTQNPDKLPKIERSTGPEQVHSVADLAFEVIALHPVVVLEVADDWLDGVGGINYLSNFRRIAGKRNALRPVPAPGLADWCQRLTPFFLKFTKPLFSGLDGRRSVDGLHINRDFLALLPAYEFETVAHHVHQTELLYVRMREGRRNCVRKALEPVHAGNEDMLKVAEMFSHFGIESSFDQSLGQLLEKTIFANQVFRFLVVRQESVDQIEGQWLMCSHVVSVWGRVSTTDCLHKIFPPPVGGFA